MALFNSCQLHQTQQYHIRKFNIFSKFALKMLIIFYLFTKTTGFNSQLIPSTKSENKFYIRFTEEPSILADLPIGTSIFQYYRVSFPQFSQQTQYSVTAMSKFDDYTIQVNFELNVNAYNPEVNIQVFYFVTINGLNYEDYNQTTYLSNWVNPTQAQPFIDEMDIYQNITIAFVAFIFFITFLTCIKTYDALRKFWLFIDFLQFCNVLACIQVTLPINLKYYLPFLGFANIHFLGNPWRQGSMGYEFAGTQIFDQYPPVNFYYFNKISNFIVNALPKIICFSSLLLGTILINMIYKIFNARLLRKKAKILQSLLKNFHAILYSFFIRVNQIFLLDFMIDIFLQYRNVSFYTALNGVSFFLAIGFFIYFLIFLLAFYLLINKGKKWEMHPLYYEQKLGELTRFLNTDTTLQRSWHLVLLCRKVLIALFLVVLYDYPLAVIILLISMHFGFLFLEQTIKPYEDDSYRWLQFILHIAMIMIYVNMLGILGYTNYYDNKLILGPNQISNTNQAGWFIVAIIFIMMFIQFGSAIYDFVRYVIKDKKIVAQIEDDSILQKQQISQEKTIELKSKFDDSQEDELKEK